MPKGRAAPAPVGALPRVRRSVSRRFFSVLQHMRSGDVGKAGRVTVFGRAVPDRAGARPYRRNGIASSNRQPSGSYPRIPCPTDDYLGQQWVRGKKRDRSDKRGDREGAGIERACDFVVIPVPGGELMQQVYT